VCFAIVGIVFASVGWASGLDLSWQGCATTPASSDFTYACDGNLGTPVNLQGSFRLSASMSDFAATSAFLDIGFKDAIPDFWRMTGSGCAYGIFSSQIPEVTPPCTGVNLFDERYAITQYSTLDLSPTRMRVRIDTAANAPAPVSITAEALYADCRLQIAVDQEHFLGCAGCADPGCLVLETITVFGFGSGEYYVIENQDARNWVTWQGASAFVPCPAAVPTRTSTWGQVKALYR
jgi:hypothetical protein